MTSSIDVSMDEVTSLFPFMAPNFTSNDTSIKSVPYPIKCPKSVPTSKIFLSYLPTSGWLIIICMLLLMLITLTIYIEECVFIFKNFRISVRRKKTIWVLAFFPVFSVCSFIGILVPRSGPFVHICANLYFSTCLYQILRLIVNYMGGTKLIWAIGQKGRRFKLNTLPVCCCCVCCPQPVFHGLNFFKLSLMVLQITIIRPIILFIAAVLWNDDLYITGDLSPGRSYLWILTINVTSTMTAVYGLMMISGALAQELQEDFVIRGKIASIQGTLILTAVLNLVFGMLVNYGFISCIPLLPAKTRGEQFYFISLLVLMVPTSFLGRKFFRRESDGVMYASRPEPPVEHKEAPQGTTGDAQQKQNNKHQEQQLLNGNSYEKIDLNNQKTVQFLSRDGDESIV